MKSYSCPAPNSHVACCTSLLFERGEPFLSFPFGFFFIELCCFLVHRPPFLHYLLDPFFFEALALPACSCRSRAPPKHPKREDRKQKHVKSKRESDGNKKPILLQPHPAESGKKKVYATCGTPVVPSCRQSHHANCWHANSRLTSCAIARTRALSSRSSR